MNHPLLLRSQVVLMIWHGPYSWEGEGRQQALGDFPYVLICMLMELRVKSEHDASCSGTSGPLVFLGLS